MGLVTLCRSAAFIAASVAIFGAAGALAQIPISTPEDLHNIRDNAGGDFILVNDIDLDHATLCSLYGNVHGTLGNWYDEVSGWQPIGEIDEFNGGPYFWGTLDGDGHVIRNLYINRPTQYKSALIAWICGDPDALPSPGWNVPPYGEVRDLRLEDVDITGDHGAAALVGLSYGTITGCSATGAVETTGGGAGGLIGTIQGGTITECYARVDVSGTGLHNGGFAGAINDAHVARCFAAGDVAGDVGVGGFTSSCQWGGDTDTGPMIVDCYAYGNVHANGPENEYYGYMAGGFAGVVSDWRWDSLVNPLIKNCYSIGAVSVAAAPQYPGAGPFIGLDEGGSSVMDPYSYYNLETAMVAPNGLGTPRTTAEMTYPHAANTYEGWDFVSTWVADTAGINDGYPYFPWQTFEPSTDPYQITQTASAHLLSVVDNGVPYPATTTVTIAADPSGSAPWRGISVELSYDPTYLAYVSFAPLYDHPSAFEVLEITENVPGTLVLDVAILGNATESAVANLFAVTFDAIAEPASPHTTALHLGAVLVRDANNQPISPVTVDADEVITIDGTVPPAVTALTVVPGPDAARVSWTLADASDVHHLELWRAVWHLVGDAAVSAYPEYDDLNPATPARAADRAGLLASAEWTLVDGALAAATVSYVDDTAPRGVYWYEVVAIDAAGNVGPLAAANDRATNYFLGDFDLDGEVSGAADLTALGAAYGRSEGEGGYSNAVDIGPTDDTSGLGIPTTDNEVEFEDLMIFALNYETVAKQGEPRIDAVVALAWEREDATTWVLHLTSPCSGLQAVRVTSPQAAVSFTAGELLQSQSAPVFLENDGRHGLDLAIATLGAPITGTGVLVRVTLAGDEAPQLSARGADNSELQVSLTTAAGDLPTLLALRGNYPNPFNPSTEIAFDLPATSAVRVTVYGLDGRLVRTLVDESLAAGRHTVTWDGVDATGRGVASGVYLCRLESAGQSFTHKMTLTK